MSTNRKPFAKTAPKPKSSNQVTNLPLRKPGQAQETKTATRRTGMAISSSSLGLDEASVDSGAPGSSVDKLDGDASQSTSRMPESLLPSTRAAILKVSGENLHHPPGLKQVKSHNIFNTKKESKADNEVIDMDKLMNDDASVDVDDQSIDNTSTLTAKLMGLPGSLELSEDMCAKYFGIEGRQKFMRRVEWLTQQRGITCLEPEDTTESIMFTDYHEDKHASHLHVHIPFGARHPLHNHHHEREGNAMHKSIYSSKGHLLMDDRVKEGKEDGEQDGRRGSSVSIQSFDSSHSGIQFLTDEEKIAFFRRYQTMLEEERAGNDSNSSGFNKPREETKSVPNLAPHIHHSTANANMNLQAANEEMMLRMSRLRSGDDPRDAEEKEEKNPYLKEAQDRNMEEDYIALLAEEEQEEGDAHDRGDSIASAQQKRAKKKLIITVSDVPEKDEANSKAIFNKGSRKKSILTSIPKNLSNKSNIAGKVDSFDKRVEELERGKQYKLASTSIDSGDGDEDEEGEGRYDQFEGTEEEQEREAVRTLLRGGATSKRLSWKRCYLRKYGKNLKFESLKDIKDREYRERRRAKVVPTPIKTPIHDGGRCARLQANDNKLRSPVVNKSDLDMMLEKAQKFNEKHDAGLGSVSHLTFEALSRANEEFGSQGPLHLGYPSNSQVLEEGSYPPVLVPAALNRQSLDSMLEWHTRMDGLGDTSVLAPHATHGLESKDDNSIYSNNGNNNSNNASVTESLSPRTSQKKLENIRLVMNDMKPQDLKALRWSRRPQMHYDQWGYDKEEEYLNSDIHYYDKPGADEGGGVKSKEGTPVNTPLKPLKISKKTTPNSSNNKNNEKKYGIKKSSSSSFLPPLSARSSMSEASALSDAYTETSAGSSVLTLDTVTTMGMRMELQDRSVPQERPLSPRSKYITNCIREGLAPRASLIVRKSMTKKLNLASYGMGDQMARILADSIADLPFLQSIDIADNRLTDDGMGPILLAAVKIDNLLELNLSKNVMDDVSSDALANYLKDPKCTLQRLIMQTADVDDFEAEAFVDAVKENRSLVELDLSSNLIGGAENLNTVYPDLITGSEALADLLRTDGIKLQSLHLSWNMIRLDGAVDFCSALDTNRTLTFLDLSYNSLAQDGGISLGSAIEDNHHLKELVIANNSIDAVACFTICVGIILNRSLKKVVFDGNPIAEQGTRALMLVPMHAGSRVEISAKKCNTTMRDPRCWFEFDKPVRLYDLDLSNGFERAVAIVTMMVIACHHSFIFKDMQLYQDNGAGKLVAEPLELKQALNSERSVYFSARERGIVNALTRIKDSADDIQMAIRLFQEVDEDGSGEIDREEFGEMVKGMGIGMSESRVDEVFATYDVDGGGAIGLSEFLQFLKTQGNEAKSRVDDLTKMPIMVSEDCEEDEHGPKMYIPPKEGKLTFEILDGFVTKEIKRVMSSVDHRNVEKLVNASGDGQTGQTGTMMAHALNSTKLRLDEALGCCEAMKGDGFENTKIMRMVLPQIDTFQDAQNVVKSITGGDRSELMKLKREIGHSMRPILGAPNGYYVLDLAEEMDRFCMIRLLEISKTNAKRRQERHNFFSNTQIGDLSQHRNWSCFRNELFNGEPIEIDENFATPVPKSGHLEFDFVCGSYIRPNVDDMILPDTRIVKVLVNSYLLEPGDAMHALKKLKHYMHVGDQSLDADGHTVYEQSCKRAHHVGICIDEFYEHLNVRRDQYQESLLKEGSAEMDPVTGFVVDDMDSDEQLHNDVNDSSGYKIGVHEAISESMNVRGADPDAAKKKKAAKKKGPPEGGYASVLDIPDELPAEEGEDEGEDEQSDDEMHRSKESVPRSKGSHTNELMASLGLDKEGNEIQEEGRGIDFWRCESCREKNPMYHLKCQTCSHSIPDHHMEHGSAALQALSAEQLQSLGIGIEEQEDAIQKALRKKGRVEGKHKHNPNEVLDEKYDLIKLGANEKTEHADDNDDMRSDYSSDLENRKKGEEDTDSESELVEEEEADMVKFVEMKLHEKQKEKELKQTAEVAIRARRRFEEYQKFKAKEQLEAGLLDEEVDEDPSQVLKAIESIIRKEILAEENKAKKNKKKSKKDANVKHDKDGRRSPSPDAVPTRMIDLSEIDRVISTNAEIMKAKQAADDDASMTSLSIEERRKEAEEMGLEGDDGDSQAQVDSEGDASSVHKTNRATDMEMYAMKMRTMLERGNLHIGAKAHRLVEWMEETFGRVWILARHLALIVECFRGIGHKKQTKWFGTYRVDLVVALFHRVVDVHNIEMVLKVMSPFEVACCYARLGWLHLWNPCKPEGGWELGLTRPEERLVVKMLCELATVEPGDNWTEQYFQWQRDVEGMPGWELTAPWLTEEGLPARGIVTVYYYSGEGKGLKQCRPNISFRKSLLLLTLIEEVELVEEGFRDRATGQLVGEFYMYNNSGRWKNYLGCIVDLTRVR